MTEPPRVRQPIARAICRVGQRRQTETLAGIDQAFLARRTWKQAELARDPRARRALQFQSSGGIGARSTR